MRCRSCTGNILKAEYDPRDTVVRARRTKYIPVVLSRGEIDKVVFRLSPPYDLIVQLLYGCGLRLFECLNRWVHGLNLDEKILTVHDGKGKKDRTVPLPRLLVPAIRAQTERLERLHDQDREAKYDGVIMPGALTRKWRSASTELTWQWLFPAATLTLAPETGDPSVPAQKGDVKEKTMANQAGCLSLTASNSRIKDEESICFRGWLLIADFGALLRNASGLATPSLLAGQNDSHVYIHTIKEAEAWRKRMNGCFMR